MTTATKYTKQRAKKTPPHVTLRSLRSALGLTMDQVIERIRQEVGDEALTLTRGHISAIENGGRGPSQQLLDAMCAAYGLDAGSIVTNFEPRSRELVSGDAG